MLDPYVVLEQYHCFCVHWDLHFYTTRAIWTGLYNQIYDLSFLYDIQPN